MLTCLTSRTQGNGRPEHAETAPGGMHAARRQHQHNHARHNDKAKNFWFGSPKSLPAHSPQSPTADHPSPGSAGPQVRGAPSARVAARARVRLHLRRRPDTRCLASSPALAPTLLYWGWCGGGAGSLFPLVFYFVPLRHCRAHSHQSPLSSQSGRSLEPPRPVRRDRHRGRCDS